MPKTSKLILCGEIRVGKTSIRRNYVGSSFVTNHIATLGADLSVKKIELVDGNTLELQIWDLARHEGFESLRSRYFHGTHIAFMFFDLTLRSSFEAIEEWLDQLWQTIPSRDLPIVILGNKCDLEDHEITDKEVKTYVSELEKDLPYVRYYKTSALTGENIDKCFTEVAKELLSL